MTTYRRIAALCIAIALVAGVASAAGVFLRGDGATKPAVSIRGEHYEYVTGGIYANNPERVVAEGVGWDAVTLFVVVPALLLAVPAVSRGSLRARLFALGLLGYLTYQYLMYAMFWALGPLFPVFVVLFPASAAAIVWIVTTLDVATLGDRFDARFPRRGMAIFSAVMALMLVLMWSKRIATGLSGDMAGAMMLGQPTLSVQALDLGIVVPLALLTAVTTWRGHRWGYLLTPVFAVKGVTMAGAIVAMLISAWMVEGAPDLGGLAIFGTATLAAGWLVWLVFRSLGSKEGRTRVQTEVTPA